MDQEQLAKTAERMTAEQVTDDMPVDEQINLLERNMMTLLDLNVMPPVVGRVGSLATGGAPAPKGRWLMGEDPRLPTMPERPTLVDFFTHRILLDRRGGVHLLQSAQLALDNGLPEPMVLACLLHDISVVTLIRTDHGHWGAQMVAPYVDEEVTWAIKHHQALRFRPDPELGYEYPANYMSAFGEDYTPPEYITREWDYCVNHRWYGSAMQVCLNDLYSFDPNVKVEIGTFEDIIGRHFRQPKEGLGFDGSPVAHMWRTVILPNNFL